MCRQRQTAGEVRRVVGAMARQHSRHQRHKAEHMVAWQQLFVPCTTLYRTEGAVHFLDACL